MVLGRYECSSFLFFVVSRNLPWSPNKFEMKGEALLMPKNVMTLLIICCDGVREARRLFPLFIA